MFSISHSLRKYNFKASKGRVGPITAIMPLFFIHDCESPNDKCVTEQIYTRIGLTEKHFFVITVISSCMKKAEILKPKKHIYVDLAIYTFEK